jgi:NADPH:quinone reductase-like Zn-dependent oxidoreductase
MRAYQLPAAGSIDALREVDLPMPKPGRGQVLVKVAACSLNYRDLAIALGRYRAGSKPDLVPLSDGAGEVVEVGPDVTRFRAGDRVASCFFQRWSGGRQGPDAQASALGGSIDGMLAEYVVIEEDGTVRLPEHLSFEEGATLPCAALTAWHAVAEHGQTVPGNCVLVQGTGGVSTFALQFAKMLGAEVVAISSSDAKLARAKALGAKYLINYKTTPDWDKAARAATGGQGVDQVVEVGGTGTLARSLNAIRITGRISLIGVLAGTADFDPMQILVKRANVQGISVGSRQMFESMNRAIAANGMKPVVDKVFLFAETRAAYRHLQSAAHVGKVVIRMG